MNPPIERDRVIRRRLLALALLLLGSASALSAIAPAENHVWRTWKPLMPIAALVTISTAVLMLLTSASRRRSAAVIRLDWFLPFLRKKKSKETLAPPTLWMRAARRCLPGRWFADPLTGKPGDIRKLLKWLGPSVVSSPLRRVVQAAALLLFVFLFFYVCWPYTARPAAEGSISNGWNFAGIENESGRFVFERETAAASQFTRGQILHAVSGTSSNEPRQAVASFIVNQQSPTHLELSANGALDAQQLDTFLTSSSTWSFHEQDPGRWPSHYTDDLAQKERVPAELFLIIDPLVSLSTAIAARSWVWSLVCAAAILLVCVLIPRGFCGYLCPLGTVIDLFDWSIASRVKRFQVPDNGWWVHVKYYLLIATLVCALFGVLISGYVAAIPVVTRGFLFLGEPLQSGVLRGWHQVPSFNAGHIVSIGLLALVLSLGFLRPRFWCKYVCPSGAVFSLGNLFRVTERKVESSCIHCNKCVEICPFDAIKADFTTRTSDCTLCQTCGGVCPTHAIKFVERWNVVELKVDNDPPTGERTIGRRGFLSWGVGATAAGIGAAAMVATTKVSAAASPDFIAVRPPGSVPEPEFLQMCIRCGECFKACPNNVLQPEAFQQGLEGLWTPLVNANWAGCESSCNACGQVCPTGAIRALPLSEKKVARMGLAIVNSQTCLPLAGREACQLCVDECDAAGYHAIEFMQVHTAIDAEGMPIAGSGFLAPVVKPELCVGCGLCQTRCYNINAKDKKLLKESAIIVEAGEGKEDRLLSGSYQELYASRLKKAAKSKRISGENEYFVPEIDFHSDEPSETDPNTEPAAEPAAEENPFGIH